MKFIKLMLLFLTLLSWHCLGAGIDKMSVCSLYLFEPFPSSTNGLGLVGTGFVVTNKGTSYLVSNWHVLSGRDWPRTNSLDPKGSFPTNVVIYFHSKKLGKWMPVSESLYDTNGVPLWLEHEMGGRNIDVVALPLTFQDDRVQLYPIDLELAKLDMMLYPAMSVSIIGFPGNLSKTEEFPIWKTGNIASEPEIDYQTRPLILVSAVVRPGMSGSPVIARSVGRYMTKTGDEHVEPGIFDTFVGVFSADQPDNEIALVWKARVISEILEHGQRGTFVTKQ